MGRDGREWGGRYSGIRVGSGEYSEETGERERQRCRSRKGGYRKCISGRVVIGQCGTHWLF